MSWIPTSVWAGARFDASEMCLLPDVGWMTKFGMWAAWIQWLMFEVRVMGRA